VVPVYEIVIFLFAAGFTWQPFLAAIVTVACLGVFVAESAAALIVAQASDL